MQEPMLMNDEWMVDRSCFDNISLVQNYVITWQANDSWAIIRHHYKPALSYWKYAHPLMTFGIPSAYSWSINDMDKMCDGYPWCITKTTTIQDNYGLLFRHSTCADHLQCQNDYFDYIHCNEGMRNNTKWVGSTFLPIGVGNVSPERIRSECNIWCSTSVCIALCHARIIYVQSTSTRMSKASPLHWSVWSPCVQWNMLWVIGHVISVHSKWSIENTQSKKKLNHNDGNKQIIFGQSLVQNLIHLARPSHGRFILRGGYGKNHHTCVPKLL